VSTRSAARMTSSAYVPAFSRQGAAAEAPPGSLRRIVVCWLHTSSGKRRPRMAPMPRLPPRLLSRSPSRLLRANLPVKWPNDVLINRRKVAGILVETLPALSPSPAAVLVGIGINANVNEFPPELATYATSLTLQGSPAVNVDALEEAVRARMFARLGQSWSEVLAAWRDRDSTAGTRYRAWVDGAEVAATATGVADSGSLLLRLDNGEEREVFAATSVLTAAADTLCPPA